jgi:hypothetical protein
MPLRYIEFVTVLSTLSVVLPEIRARGTSLCHDESRRDPEKAE